MSGEHHEEVVEKLMRTVAAVGSKFRILKVLGPLDLGRAQFIRFETDCNRKYIEYAAKKHKRGFIVSNAEGQYIATFGGWSGPVSAAGMQEVTRPGFRKTFRGPGEPFWERQFQKEGRPP